jgi:hypothetical protein
VRNLIRSIERATVAAAQPHAALLRAGLAVVEERPDGAIPHLYAALGQYAAADMAIHREVVRGNLGRILGGTEGRKFLAQSEEWMVREGVPEMAPLTRAVAPGLEVHV